MWAKNPELKEAVVAAFSSVVAEFRASGQRFELLDIEEEVISRLGARELARNLFLSRFDDASVEFNPSLLLYRFRQSCD